MAKSKKVVSKKVVGPVAVAPAEAPVAPAISASPVQAAVPPTPASAPVPAADKRGRKGQVAEKAPADPAAEARARWARRLGRWQAKAQAAGVDTKALMTEALAG